jgi:hypothetical protein
VWFAFLQSFLTMGKKKKKVKGASASKKPIEQIDKSNATVSEAAGEPFDFGGLPDRDLKKNLGCG